MSQKRKRDGGNAGAPSNGDHDATNDPAGAGHGDAAGDAERAAGNENHGGEGVGGEAGLPTRDAGVSLQRGQSRRNQQQELAAIRYASVCLAYLASTAELFIQGVAEAPWLVLVLAGLAIAGMMAGIALRVTSFLFTGCAFLVLALLTMLYHASAPLGWTWIWYAAGMTGPRRAAGAAPGGVNGDVAMVRLLLDHEADPHIGIYPHRDATTAYVMAQDRGLEEIGALIEQTDRERREAMSCPNATVSPVQDELNEAIRAADAEANARAIAILDGDTSLINACDREGRTPLHVACEALNEPMVRWLGLDHPEKADWVRAYAVRLGALTPRRTELLPTSAEVKRLRRMRRYRSLIVFAIVADAEVSLYRWGLKPI